MSNPTNAPAGFYDDGTGSGRRRWFNGHEWTDQYQAAPVQPQQAPVQVAYAAPVQTDSKKARDKAVYTREQIGHSAIKWTLISIFTGGIGLIWVIYYNASPRHYWHA